MQERLGPGVQQDHRRTAAGGEVVQRDAITLAESKTIASIPVSFLGDTFPGGKSLARIIPFLNLSWGRGRSKVGGGRDRVPRAGWLHFAHAGADRLSEHHLQPSKAVSGRPFSIDLFSFFPVSDFHLLVKVFGGGSTLVSTLRRVMKLRIAEPAGALCGYQLVLRAQLPRPLPC